MVPRTKKGLCKLDKLPPPTKKTCHGKLWEADVLSPSGVITFSNLKCPQSIYPFDLAIPLLGFYSIEKRTSPWVTRTRMFTATLCIVVKYRKWNDDRDNEKNELR